MKGNLTKGLRIEESKQQPKEFQFSPRSNKDSMKFLKQEVRQLHVHLESLS